MKEIESHPFFHFQDIPVVSINILFFFFTTKASSTWTTYYLYFKHNQIFWSDPNKDSENDTRDLILSTWNLLEYGQKTVIWRLPHEVPSCDWDFLFPYVLSWTANQVLIPPTPMSAGWIVVFLIWSSILAYSTDITEKIIFGFWNDPTKYYGNTKRQNKYKHEKKIISSVVQTVKVPKKKKKPLKSGNGLRLAWGIPVVTYVKYTIAAWKAYCSSLCKTMQR